MAKFTTKFVRDNIEGVVGDQLDFNALKVTSKQKSKKGNGKMVEVVDQEATVRAVEGNLLYYRGYLDAMMVFESKFPEGIADIVNGKMADWEALRATYEEKFPEAHEAWAEQFNIEPYEDVEAADTADDEEAEEEEDEGADYSDMSLSELRAECKERGIRFTPKDKADALVEKLEAWDEENAESEDDEDESDSEEEEAEEDEGVDYSALSLGELRKECKARGIKYTPKDKSDALIAKLEEADAAAEEDDSEEETEDEDDEEPGEDYSALGLGELRKLAKERGIKYTPKTKAEELVAALEEYDAENSDEADDEEAEEEEDEGADYSDMSLSELRAECKSRGIKYTPKQKAADLIALLEEDDGSSESEEEDEESEGEDEEDGDEEVSEEELDQILDEEFEDETLEEEEGKAPGKGNKAKKLPPKKGKGKK